MELFILLTMMGFSSICLLILLGAVYSMYRQKSGGKLEQDHQSDSATADIQ